MHALVKAGCGLAAAGVGVAGYAVGYEVRAFCTRRVAIACLPPGSSPLTVLHVSDIHLLPRHEPKLRWLASLADERPDLVINTGDNLSHEDSVAPLMRAFEPLRGIPGVFVFGSNDYWAPVMKSPLRYFLPNGGRRTFHGPPLPWKDLQRALVSFGWTDLDNRRATLEVAGHTLAFAGVDDPHLRYDRLGDVAGPADPAADLRIGVTHAPYRRVLDQFTADGYDLIFAGHTHGGQLRIPGYGALVTNCDLDRGRARGLRTHTGAGRTAWLHVSAGCGTSPYAPYRFACRPEATVVTLTAR